MPDNKLTDSFETYCAAAKAGRVHRERRTNANTQIFANPGWALWLKGSKRAE